MHLYVAGDFFILNMVVGEYQYTFTDVCHRIQYPYTESACDYGFKRRVSVDTS